MGSDSARTGSRIKLGLSQRNLNQYGPRGCIISKMTPPKYAIAYVGELSGQAEYVLCPLGDEAIHLGIHIRHEESDVMQAFAMITQAM